MISNISRRLILKLNQISTPGSECSLRAIPLRSAAHTYVSRPKPIKVVKYEALAASLKAKGYNRSQKPYTPPQNVQQIVEELSTRANLSSGTNGTNFTMEDKFNFLTLCASEFNHVVPNSLLHEINSIVEVKQFYETPAKTILPLDELQMRELPSNLHIQNKYLRFHPGTDKMSGRVSPFPGEKNEFH